MDFQPTEEFRTLQKDNPTRREAENDAVAFFRVAQTSDGQRVLAFLERFTDRPVPFEQLPHGAVHKEGQRWILREIRTQVAFGERVLHGSSIA